MSLSPLASGLAPQIKLGPGVPKVSFAKTQQGRKTLLIKTVDAVHAGHIDEATGAAVLKKAGFPDSKNPFSNRHASVGGAIHAVASPLGLSRSDIRRSTKADLSAYYQAHPGVTRIPIKDAGPPAAGTIGTGLISSLIQPYVQNWVYSPGGLYSGITDPGGTVKRLAENVTHPSGAFEAGLLAYLGAHGIASGALRGRAAAQALRTEGTRAAVTRSAHEGGSILHTPYAKPVPITIPGARLEGPATEAGVLPRDPGITIERPVIQNPLIRPFSRARSRRIERKVTSEEAERPAGLPITIRGNRFGARTHEKLRGSFSAQATVGREIRARQRVVANIENAHAQALARAVHGLSPAERDAITVVAISGREALDTPAVAIARQTATHQHFIGVGGDEAQNVAHIRSLQNARAVLENPSPKFANALRLAQEVSGRTETKLVQGGHLEESRALGRQQHIADIYGYDTPPAGSFYFPLSERYMGSGMMPSGGMSRPSQFGMAPVSASRRVPGVNQRMTGGQLASGRLPDVGQATAVRAQQVNTLEAVRQQYDDLFSIGRTTRRSEFDIPIRSTAQVKGELRRFFSDLHKRVDEAPDLNAGELITEGDIAALRELLDASAQHGLVPVGSGSNIPGIRWVDSRLIAEQGVTAKGRFLSAADAITNPIRVFQLYARPAYILNLAGNIGMNGISEGARVFPALRWAATAQKDLPDPLMREIDAGMGVSLSRTLSVGRGFGGELTDRMAEFWNRITDMHSRRAAFHAAAAREGFKGNEGIARLMTDPAHEAAKVRVFRQANKNIVDYSSLSPFERDEVRRLIYFYPWVSRATIWSLRTLVEHPYKSYTLYELGKIGAENAHKGLGEHLPDWAEQLGLVPVGGSGDRTKVINPSSVWTPTTAVQAFTAGFDTVKAAIGLPHTGQGFGDLLTPAGTLLKQSASRQEGGNAREGLIGLAESIPYFAAAKRQGAFGAPSDTYPETGWGTALGPLTIGGFFPRGASRAALGEQAVRGVRSPRAKLLIQVDQLVEAGALTPERAAQMKVAIAGEDDKAIRVDRRRAGEMLQSIRPARASTVNELRGLIDAGVRAGLITQEDADAKKHDAASQTEAVLTDYMSDLKAALHR